MIDLLIAGGGPAGLATALYAARAGLEVVVREPRTGTIDKACGEGLMPGAVEALGALGVHPEGHPFRGIRYVDHRQSATAGFRSGQGLGVRRTTLQRELRRAVDEAGVAVEPMRVDQLEQRADRILVDGTPARYLVAADGLHSPVRRTLGLQRATLGTRRFGLRAHVAVAPWSDYVEVHWSPAAEAYVTPVGPRLVGVAILSRARLAFREQLKTFPTLTPQLEGRSWSAVRGAGPLRQRTTRRVAGRVLLVGDASGYVDALTGEGIALSVAQAEAAVAAVVDGRPEGYEAEWRRITRRYRLLTHALLGGTRPSPLRNTLVPAAAALPRAFTATVNLLASAP